MDVFETFMSNRNKDVDMATGPFKSSIEHIEKKYKFSPSVLLGKGFRTQQFAITTVPQRVIFESQLKFFSLMVEAGDNVYIGSQDVTISSGMLLSEGFATSFGVLENVDIYAVSSGSNILYLLDMGLY